MEVQLRNDFFFVKKVSRQILLAMTYVQTSPEDKEVKFILPTFLKKYKKLEA